MKKMKEQKNKPYETLIYYRDDNNEAKSWEEKIINQLKKNGIKINLDSEKPEVVIILGGDGTILEAVRKFSKFNPLFLGLNLGHVGFLASVRDENEFINAINKFIENKYSITERMMMDSKVMRNKKIIKNYTALNDVSIQNLLGMVKLSVSIDNHPLQNIHGSGMLVATATGSTAYNLSAHGPIVMPDIRCFIITEILDHNIPTPPLVVKQNRIIEIKVESFRKREPFLLQYDGTPADVIISADGESIFALQEKDIVRITESLCSVRFVEFEDNYFFKSLAEKFSFR